MISKNSVKVAAATGKKIRGVHLTFAAPAIIEILAAVELQFVYVTDKALHLICDNYATHKHPKVRDWLAKHPRFSVHFTPISASWLNMVERFFRNLTTARLRRGVFRSVRELIAAIKQYIAVHNHDPKPLVWTAKANDILQKVIRANSRLSSKTNEALHWPHLQ